MIMIIGTNLHEHCWDDNVIHAYNTFFLWEKNKIFETGKNNKFLKVKDLLYISYYVPTLHLKTSLWAIQPFTVLWISCNHSSPLAYIHTHTCTGIFTDVEARMSIWLWETNPLGWGVPTSYVLAGNLILPLSTPALESDGSVF